jgi:hypothetical protein
MAFVSKEKFKKKITQHARKNNISFPYFLSIKSHLLRIFLLVNFPPSLPRGRMVSSRWPRSGDGILGSGLGVRTVHTYIHTGFSSLPFPSLPPVPLRSCGKKTRQDKQNKRAKPAEISKQKHPSCGVPAAAGAARERDRGSESASQREESLAGVCYSEVREGTVPCGAVRCDMVCLGDAELLLRCSRAWGFVW